ncbi:MAG: DUF4249 family protein [Bacteroidota bacterium]
MHKNPIPKFPVSSFGFPILHKKQIISILLILVMPACVDRITFDIGEPVDTIVVDGHISTHPGPYRITLNSASDIQSKISIRTGVSAKAVIISDNLGNSETLREVENGVYETKADGIRGVVGRIYTMQVRLRDGRVYESLPDTLFSGGTMDSIYYVFKSEETMNGTIHGFDIFFNSSGVTSKDRFLWQFKGTFKADTHPELCNDPMHPCEPCADPTCYQCHYCNIAPLCSGLRNIGSVHSPRFVRVAPCECCTCWYDLFNDAPILNDLTNKDGTVAFKKAYHVPLDRWIFQHKIHIQVSQRSLSSQSYRFWKAIREQKEGINNLFQPVSGKIPRNFIQLEGKPARIEGLFFATSITQRSAYIGRYDVPTNVKIPSTAEFSWNDSCLKLFPNSTATKPDYWID